MFMTISAHQPEYLPYLGFFYKMAKADEFILVDHLQFSRKGFQNRNRIRTNSNSQGWVWLTVPVLANKKGYQKINEVQIDNSTPWAKHHWQLIYFNYKRTPFFDKYSGFFEKLYSKKWQKLVDLNETIIQYIKRELGIKTTLIKSSDYDFKGLNARFIREAKNPVLERTDLIIELCKEFKANSYLSGSGGKSYIEIEKFKDNNLKLVFSDFKHPIYPQRFEPFMENLSAIDLLFNEGPKSLEVIKKSIDYL
ncbi:MAG: WbqC family protein [Patescibacteria group bacterium]